MSTIPLNPPKSIGVTATFPKNIHMKDAYRHVEIHTITLTKSTRIIRTQHPFKSKEGQNTVYHYFAYNAHGRAFHVTLSVDPLVWKLIAYEE